ncbi:GDP-L-fucose synthase, partial [Streptomyces sp. NPDC046712]
RKLLDVSRLTGLGWKPAVALSDGIAATYAWWREQN